MVVQCPTCSSKFRIADEKVTDRGVRVRCTSCKNVFQVRKSGVSPGDGPEAAQPPSPSRPTTGSRFASRSPAAGNPAGNAAARRVESEDLFGMGELTGDAPSTRRLQPAAAKPAVQPVPSFDEFNLDLGPAPEPSRPAVPSAPLPPTVSGEHVMLGAFKTTALKDPFDGMDMGEPGTGALDLASQPEKDKLDGAGDAGPRLARASEPAPRLKPAPAQAGEKAAPVREPEPPPAKTVVSAVLTGIIAAVAVIAVVSASALRGHPGVGWFGFGAGSNLVATGVVSGVYDTASGKPVFYVRGRVENHGPQARGPIRVVAEILHDGTPESRAEATAGAEPTAEDVHSLKSAADAERLTRSLDAAAAGKKAAPGGSLPFFAVIAEPPQDLRDRSVRVRFETAESPPAKAQAR